MAEQVETLQKQWQQRAASWEVDHDDTDHDDLYNDIKEYQSITNKERTYVPPHIRKDLIKELYKSLEYRYISVEEIVRRLIKVFAIPRLRAQVQNILGNYLVCY